MTKTVAVVTTALIILLWTSPGISAEAPKRYTKDQFNHLITGKSKEEVVKILGKPDEVSSSSNWYDGWEYKHRFLVYDPITDKTFNRAFIAFVNNKCQGSDLHTD